MTREEALAKELVYYCLECSCTYKEIPSRQYEDGHGGRLLGMCGCGCDLFARLDNNSQEGQQ